MGFTEGFYYNPRIDKELLRKHSKGLIGLSACLGGVVNKPLLREGIRCSQSREYKDIFEPGSFFLEIQDNGYKEQVAANQTLLEDRKNLRHSNGGGNCGCPLYQSR